MMSHLHYCAIDFIPIVTKGNGKVKIKEPLEMANKAIAQLNQVLDMVNAN